MRIFGVGAIKGLIVTLKYLLRPTFTTQYPEEKLKTSPRFRGNKFVF